MRNDRAPDWAEALDVMGLAYQFDEPYSVQEPVTCQRCGRGAAHVLPAALRSTALDLRRLPKPCRSDGESVTAERDSCRLHSGSSISSPPRRSISSATVSPLAVTM